MKKYIKPELFYEHFELSQHIADCAWEWVNLTEEATCAAKPDLAKLPFEGPEYHLFIAEPICTFPSSVYTDYCYQGGAPDANLFKS